MSVRVRHIIKTAPSDALKELQKLLPKIPVPTLITHRYPAAILSVFLKEERYSLLGCVTEDLLRLPATDITVDAVWTAVQNWYPGVDPKFKDKLTVSKTTEPFLEHVRKTRTELDAIVKGKLTFDTVVAYDSVEGHPDAQTPTQIFEVKTTGMLEDNWKQFLFQVFAYAALDLTATDVYLVLPLQETVWHYNVSTWTNRVAYRDLFNHFAKRLLNPDADKSVLPGQALATLHGIGSHMPKLKTLTETVKSLPPSVPSQIFLSGPMNSKVTAKEEDVAAAKALLTTTQPLFVHSPYMINLCSDPAVKDDYSTGLLIKYLQIAVPLGSKGVVVHVGKSTSQDLKVAMDNMRTNLMRAIPYATETCPILLETPAGQGTEVLTDFDEFLDFVTSFKDPRLKICVDTCHVFATGYEPKDYAEGILIRRPDLLTLVHFNDSSTPCGSCVDRHAFIGTGDIGLKKLTEVAELCTKYKVPMVIE